ncbi:MAG TPA: hypothetical protein VLZ78_07055, partial [Terrimesophilobacter sp.]|nr:hypothetical protein [Terrimesophilobacter sp.]
DVVVVEHLGLFLGQDNDATGSVGESFEHLFSSPGTGLVRCRYKESNQGSAPILPLFALGVTQLWGRICLKKPRRAEPLASGPPATTTPSFRMAPDA